MEYIKPGTIGYIKDENNVIRQVRCVDYTIDSCIYPVRWLVAGTSQIIRTGINGISSVGRTNVYLTPEGAYDRKNLVKANASFNATDVTLNFYPSAELYLNFEHNCYVHIYNVTEHMNVVRDHYGSVVFFNVSESGVTPEIIKLKKGAFLTEKDARDSRPKPTIITFDENEPTEVDTTCEISNGSSKQPRMDIKTDENKAVFLCIGTSIIDWADNNPFVEPLVTLDDFEENGFDKEDFERSQKLAVGEKWQTDFPNDGVFIMRVQ